MVTDKILNELGEMSLDDLKYLSDKVETWIGIREQNEKDKIACADINVGDVFFEKLNKEHYYVYIIKTIDDKLNTTYDVYSFSKNHIDLFCNVDCLALKFLSNTVSKINVDQTFFETEYNTFKSNYNTLISETYNNFLKVIDNK